MRSLSLSGNATSNLKTILGSQDIELILYEKPDRHNLNIFVGQVRIMRPDGKEEAHQVWPRQFKKERGIPVGRDYLLDSNPFPTLLDADEALEVQGVAQRVYYRQGKNGGVRVRTEEGFFRRLLRSGKER